MDIKMKLNQKWKGTLRFGAETESKISIANLEVQLTEEQTKDFKEGQEYTVSVNPVKTEKQAESK